MTRQIPDGIKFKGEEYVILFGPARFGFDPHDFRLFPSGYITANYRGFFCEYAVVEGRLILDILYVNDSAGYYPYINGVEVEAPETEMAEVMRFTGSGFETKMEEVPTNEGYHVYKDLRLPMKFTGVAMVGRDMIAWSIRNGGYPEPWCFGVVLELEFESGILKRVSDISGSFVEKREEKVRCDEAWWADPDMNAS